MSDNGWPRPASAGAISGASASTATPLNDLPLLERATDPVATNPSPGLEADRGRQGMAHRKTVRTMIKTFIDRLLGKTSVDPSGARAGKRVEVPKAEHGIDPALVVDERAVKVVSTLVEGGYEAYIVGGAVRDLLVGMRPKDFDVATNATPGAGEGPVPARLHHRPALPHRPRRVRPRPPGPGACRKSSRSRPSAPCSTPPLPIRSPATRRRSKRELEGKSQRRRRGRAACCATTSGARRSRTPRGATSPINAMYYDPMQGNRGRLPRRHQGREEEAAAHDRRPGHALPRRPGAHHSRGALRGQARLRDRGQDARPGQGHGDAARQRAAIAHLRRDDQAAADRPRAGQRSPS